MLIPMSDKSIAVIVDIVGSRRAPDRRQAQAAVEETFEATRRNPEGPRLYATVGDEFQIAYASLADALVSTLMARLALPEHVDFRVGLGEGEIRDVTTRSDGVPIQDGSAWWAAREAIDEAHRREDRGSPYLRSWFVDADGVDERTRLITSHLILRDQLVTRMPPRARRLTAGVLSGTGQEELARSEGISQPAVSQSLHRYGGAALLAAVQLFTGTDRA